MGTWVKDYPKPPEVTTIFYLALMICWIDSTGPNILVELISNWGTTKSILWMRTMKMVMRTKYNSYMFLVMLFGMCNALSTLTTFMNSIFHEKLNKFNIIYIDDILVYFKIVKKHTKHLEYVLFKL
jgi:hypothetical protein